MPPKPWMFALPCFAALIVACGGMIAPTQEEGAGQRGAGAAGAAGGSSPSGGTKAAPPADTGIPTGPSRPPGAVGTTPCTPLAQPSPVNATTPTEPLVLLGKAWHGMMYAVDRDPERPGHHRAFIQRGFVFERHALNKDEATPGTYVIDRGHHGPGANHFFVLGPVANGVLATPRVFYGPADAIDGDRVDNAGLSSP